MKTHLEHVQLVTLCHVTLLCVSDRLSISQLQDMNSLESVQAKTAVAVLETQNAKVTAKMLAFSWLWCPCHVCSLHETESCSMATASQALSAAHTSFKALTKAFLPDLLCDFCLCLFL